MRHRLISLVFHMLAGWVSLWMAFYVRFYLGSPPPNYESMMAASLPWAMLLKGAVAEALGLTRGLWRYASFQDLRRVFAATLLGSVLLVLAVYTFVAPNFPKGPLLLDCLITFGAFAGLRFSGRALREGLRGFQGLRGSRRLPVLILGAGDEGDLALRFLWQSTARPAKVVGFLDDDPAKQGLSLHGVKVLGPVGSLGKILASHKVEEVIIALPRPEPQHLRQLFTEAVEAGCRVGILPELTSTDEPMLHRNPIREVRLTDFLGREPVALDPTPVREALSGKTVLVTGAGGSIGSELCRQIAGFPVKALVLLDMAENALFEIAEEIGETHPDLTIHTVLCDIRMREDLRRVLGGQSPDVIFHAAACKHVSMMELHPVDAARTNVIGTQNVVGLALEAGVPRLLHVSTDKAVDAEGVMGASKALSERVVRQVAHTSGRAYSCVRFGNVLGSNGSVIPLFEKQLKRGGPLKVTHEDATRYFMTIEEAVTLMLQAEALRGVGEIFILDMGEPVRIMRLAEQMLQLSGRKPGEASGIRIVGLRPGERLHERLYSRDQALAPTRVPKVNRLEDLPEAGGLEQHLETLAQAVTELDGEKVRHLLVGGRGAE